MDKAIEKTLEQKIHEAICYRMVSYIGITEMAHQWGFLPDSLGYNEAKKIFAKRYSLMRFEDFYDDLLVAHMKKIVTKDKQKHTMRSVLDEEESNEEQRPLYLRVNEKYEQFVEKSKLQSIDDQLLSHQDKIENRLAKIDEIWQQIFDYCKKNILDREHGNHNKVPMPSWTQEEMNEVSTSIDIIRKIGKESSN